MAVPFVVIETFVDFLENHLSLYQSVTFETEKEKWILHVFIIK